MWRALAGLRVRCVARVLAAMPQGARTGPMWVQIHDQTEENMLSLELQRCPAGLGESQDGEGCINAAHASRP